MDNTLAAGNLAGSLRLGLVENYACFTEAVSFDRSMGRWLEVLPSGPW